MSLPLRDALNIAIAQLSASGVADAEIDAKELYMYMTGLDRVGLMMHWQDQLQDNQVDAYMELVERRASRTPLQHITGNQEFMGLTFKVNEHVLIPRQDTETMVEDAMELNSKGTLRGTAYSNKIAKGGDVLDLCTGSGTIGISLAKLGKGLNVVCSDLSKDALSVAKENASANGVKVKFVESDMFKELKGTFGEKKFDLIISNPPYIEKETIETLEPEVKDHEPMMALDGGDDGLVFYRMIADGAHAHLTKGGILMMEIGYNQGESVSELLREKDLYENIICLQDLTGKDRIVVCTAVDLKRREKEQKKMEKTQQKASKKAEK